MKRSPGCRQRRPSWPQLRFKRGANWYVLPNLVLKRVDRASSAAEKEGYPLFPYATEA